MTSESRSFRLRSLLRDDLARVAVLAGSHLAPLETTPEHLDANLFADPGADDALRQVATIDNAIVGVACATVRRHLGGRVRGFVKLLSVSPEHRGTGIGSALLVRLEDALRRRGASDVEIDGAAPYYLLPGLPVDAVDALAFLTRRGWKQVDERRSMTAPLKGFERIDPNAEEIVAAGIVARRARREDAPAVTRDIGAAFSADWAVEIEASLRQQPPGTHIAVSGDRVVAFACAGLWGRNAFGPMGTVAEFEGRGLGRRLLGRALSDLARTGAGDAVIAWIGPERFYARAASARSTLRYRVLRRGI